MSSLEKIRVGFVMCGSFCTFEKSFAAAQKLVELGCELVPVMSENAYRISSRFGTAQENHLRLESISGRDIIHTIEAAEPIGPKRMLDVLVVAPCTSNTLAKLAYGITDTPATMAVKSHIRNSLPVVLAIATNDALANSAKNIGMVQNYKHYFFVPYSQDDYQSKPNSIVSHFDLIPEAISAALEGKQLQPIMKIYTRDRNS
ncbi:MAG: dipicolinate synthase subunit B [Oscillospiraceae bacterium]